MMKPRISLFAEQEREDRRSRIGDPLVGLTEHVDFEELAGLIDTAAPRSLRAKGGRTPYFDPSNTSRDVYADRVYPSIEREARLKQAGWRVHIRRQGHATKGISETQKQRNRATATPLARVERVFGALNQMGGKLVRCLGIVPATFTLQLKAASYNLKRLVFLKERGMAPFLSRGRRRADAGSNGFADSSRSGRARSVTFSRGHDGVLAPKSG